MVSTEDAVRSDGILASLSARFLRTRAATLALCGTLLPEDFVVQSMPDVSPAKWHLAHVTWFFERFVLEPFAPGYVRYNDAWHYLFNSYYYSAGEMHRRADRGMLTRPATAEIVKYRRHVDAAMEELLRERGDDAEIAARTLLGINHEQQHQELLMTDVKHVFSVNPLQPAVNPALAVPPAGDLVPHRFIAGPAGICEIGAAGEAFSFDNERPRHRVLLHEHGIGSRLVTNGEFRAFIKDGGYGNSDLWLADGWATINERGWKRPLYWGEDLESEFTLGGLRELDLAAPVAHVSYYEADAFARWAGARLPTEQEWEVSAAAEDVTGNFAESGWWQPAAAQTGGLQFFGDCWEWTSSAYAPYPGFRPLPGSLGEYNGKFMCSQMTVRGGSCVTPASHMRATCRSFFYPDARWQFLGIRLAKDGGA